MLLYKVWKSSWTPGKKTPNINVLHSRLAGLNADHCTNPHAFFIMQHQKWCNKAMHPALQGYSNTISSTRISISLRVTTVPSTAGSLKSAADWCLRNVTWSRATWQRKILVSVCQLNTDLWETQPVLQGREHRLQLQRRKRPALMETAGNVNWRQEWVCNLTASAAVHIFRKLLCTAQMHTVVLHYIKNGLN